MGMVWFSPAIGERRRSVETASGGVDGEWRRGQQRATELLERRLGSLLPRFRSIFLLFFPFLVQEKICSSLRFDRDEGKEKIPFLVLRF